MRPWPELLAMLIPIHLYTIHQTASDSMVCMRCIEGDLRSGKPFDGAALAPPGLTKSVHMHCVLPRPFALV